MSQISESIWQPVGKKPSALWTNQYNQLNDVFTSLYEYFQTHQHYGYHSFAYDPEDAMRSYGTFLVARVAKWLEYHHLLTTEQAKVYSEKEGKKLTLHTLTPTPRGWQAYEQGSLIKVGTSYMNEVESEIGVGKPYPSFKEMEKWLDQTCEANKVAKYRHEKWYYEFKRLFMDELGYKLKEDAQKILTQWLMQHLATIPKRKVGNTIKAVGPVEANLSNSLTKWC